MHAQHTSSNADIIIVVVVVVLFFIFFILMWISIDLDFCVCLKENFFTQKKEKGKKKRGEFGFCYYIWRAMGWEICHLMGFFKFINLFLGSFLKKLMGQIIKVYLFFDKQL